MADLLDDDEETEQGEAYEQPLPENGNSSENKALSEKRTSTAKKEPAFPVRCLKKNQLSQRAVGKKN